MNQSVRCYSRLRSKRSLFRVALVVTICLFATGQFRRSRYPRYDALINAIDRKDTNALKAELDRGTNPDAYPDDRDSLYAEEGITPLNYAIDKGDYESVKVLLDYRANPNLGDQWHYSPLHTARDPLDTAREESIAIERLLIERDAE